MTRLFRIAPPAPGHAHPGGRALEPLPASTSSSAASTRLRARYDVRYDPAIAERAAATSPATTIGARASCWPRSRTTRCRRSWPRAAATAPRGCCRGSTVARRRAPPQAAGRLQRRDRAARAVGARRAAVDPRRDGRRRSGARPRRSVARWFAAVEGAAPPPLRGLRAIAAGRAQRPAARRQPGGAHGADRHALLRRRSRAACFSWRTSANAPTVSIACSPRWRRRACWRCRARSCSARFADAAPGADGVTVEQVLEERLGGSGHPGACGRARGPRRRQPRAAVRPHRPRRRDERRRSSSRTRAYDADSSSRGRRRARAAAARGVRQRPALALRDRARPRGAALPALPEDARRRVRGPRQPAQGHTATYLRRGGQRVAVATAFVTVYARAGLARSRGARARPRPRALRGRRSKSSASGHAFVLDGGPDERWAIWVSDRYVVKLGAPEGEPFPDALVEAYMDVYPSDLDAQGRAQPDAPSGGLSQHELAEKKQQEQERERELPRHLGEHAPK